MTYEELYRRHYANGDVALASIYEQLCEQCDEIADLEDKLFEAEDADLSRET